MTEPLAGITVAGRTFRPVTSLTVDRYNWLWGNLTACDFRGITHTGDLLVRIAAQGRTGAVMAGLYTEIIKGEQESWCGPTAEALAEFFGQMPVTDYRQFNFLELVEDFFDSVADSSDNSATASPSTGTTPPSISEATTNDSVTETPSGSSGLPCEPVPALT